MGGHGGQESSSEHVKFGWYSGSSPGGLQGHDSRVPASGGGELAVGVGRGLGCRDHAGR